MFSYTVKALQTNHPRRGRFSRSPQICYREINQDCGKSRQEAYPASKGLTPPAGFAFRLFVCFFSFCDTAQ